MPAEVSPRQEIGNHSGIQLRGKPLNCFGLTKKVVYENEEFNLYNNRAQY